VFGPELRAALVAMVRKRVPESEVEDIVQSTLADAFESPHAPRDPDTLRRWIFGVAKNKVVDYHRRAGRETVSAGEMPEVAGRTAPHTEADLLRWAEKHLPPGDENKTTLDWMLREGDGEKLEWIAESEDVPAPRVRQRVSRLRRHLKTHWQKEVTLLAALGVMLTILLLLRRNEPEPIANEDIPRALELRKEGLEKCAAGLWKPCLEKLDAAKKLDPAGDTQPAVQTARDGANKALTPSNVTPSNVTPPPEPAPTIAPTTTLTLPGPEPSSAKTRVAPTAVPKFAPTPAPMSSAFPMNDGSGTVPMPKRSQKAAPRPSKPSAGSSLDSSDFFSSDSKDGSKSAAPPKK
jgi:DNA-directed RNA polymerase specialized sigma24 family protein